MKSTTSASAVRPGVSPATTSWSSCTSSQSRTPCSTGSTRSPDSLRAVSFESQHTKLARSSTTLSSSREPASFAPMAQTSAPSRSHSPRRTGSFEVVAVTTTSCAPASRWDSAGSAPARSQKARSRSGVRQ